MAGSANPQVTATPAPGAAQPGPNIFGQSANALQRGMKMAGGNMPGFSPVTATNVDLRNMMPTTAPGISIGRASDYLSEYQNPYEQQVIDTSMADLERQRLMQQNAIGAQAGQAGAFGGSRHGVAEALTNEAFARQGGQLASGLRNQGFQTSLGAAQQDVANRLQAAMQGAQMSNQLAMANLQANTQVGLANQQAQLEAQRLNQAAALQQGQLAIQGAGQLGNLANLGFNMGQQITQQQMQQGSLQQALQQQLIDAAKAQYQGYVGAPQQSLGLPLQALGTAPVPQTTTQSRQPGLFDYLTMGATAASGTNFAGKSDPRLKTNIQPKGEFKGVKFYTWDWNEAAKGIVNPKQPTFGVMADELQKTHPHLVEMGEDGYLQVNYAQLSKELAEAA